MRQRRNLTATLVVFLCLAGCYTFDNQVEAVGDVRGTLLDELRNPVAGGTCVISGTSIEATTDASGVFLIRDVPEGSYILICRNATRTARYLQAIEVKNGVTTSLGTVLLTPEGTGGGTGGGQGGGAGGSGVRVQVIPETFAVPPNGMVNLAARVSGTTATAVTWLVEEAGGGQVQTGAYGDPSGATYYAPTSQGQYHLRATSAVEPAVFARAVAIVTATPRSSLVIAPEPVSWWPAIYPLAGKTLTAINGPRHVSGSAMLPVPEAVWSVVEGPAGGSISVDGTYTAPATEGWYHVLATVPAEPYKTAVMPVQVDRGATASLVAEPAIVTLTRGQSTQLNVRATGGPPPTLRWSLPGGPASGSVTSSGFYTAPTTPGIHLVSVDATRLWSIYITVIVQ